MNEQSINLHQLILDAREQPLDSDKRQRILTQIVHTTLKSNKLWKEHSSYYEDALQQTWLYFCRNLCACELNTTQPYDPLRSSIVTWLNCYLKRRLQDFRIQEQESKLLKSSERFYSSKDAVYTAVDQLEFVESPPDIPSIVEDVEAWARADTTGELRRVHIKGYPKANCQALILRRLPPECSWKTLAEEFDLSISTLSSFYQRQCMPRLRDFGKSQGYI